jgi:cytoskeleton protein RodZ
MTEASQEIVLGVSGDAPIALEATPGVLLASARQKLGWSVGDVAAKLRMSVQQVDALEQADYSRLPTGTFLRGFVRSYAKLVALDPELILKALEETHPDGRRPSIVVPTQNIAVSVPAERYASPRTKALLIGALVLALAGGGTYWWLHIRPDQARLADRSATKSEAVAIPLSTPAPATPPADAATANAANPATATTTQAEGVTQPAVAAPAGAATTTAPTAPSSSAPATPAPVPAEPQPAALTQTTAPLAPPAGQEKSPVVPKGSGSLKFSFTGECWVEVTEASGKTLLSRRFKAGESETVIGKLPLAVAIGNAPVTKLKYNEVDFDLAPHTRIAVARFTLK